MKTLSLTETKMRFDQLKPGDLYYGLGPNHSGPTLVEEIGNPQREAAHVYIRGLATSDEVKPEFLVSRIDSITYTEEE